MSWVKIFTLWDELISKDSSEEKTAKSKRSAVNPALGMERETPKK
ncbi:MAG: hypothetical protein QXU18_02360 [Thermoplasmatales archaeon]